MDSTVENSEVLDLSQKVSMQVDLEEILTVPDMIVNTVYVLG